MIFSHLHSLGDPDQTLRTVNCHRWCQELSRRHRQVLATRGDVWYQRFFNQVQTLNFKGCFVPSLHHKLNKLSHISPQMRPVWLESCRFCWHGKSCALGYTEANVALGISQKLVQHLIIVTQLEATYFKRIRSWLKVKVTKNFVFKGTSCVGCGFPDTWYPCRFWQVIFSVGFYVETCKVSTENPPFLLKTSLESPTFWIAAVDWKDPY